MNCLVKNLSLSLASKLISVSHLVFITTCLTSVPLTYSFVQKLSLTSKNIMGLVLLHPSSSLIRHKVLNQSLCFLDQAIPHLQYNLLYHLLYLWISSSFYITSLLLRSILFLFLSSYLLFRLSWLRLLCVSLFRLLYLPVSLEQLQSPLRLLSNLQSFLRLVQLLTIISRCCR